MRLRYYKLDGSPYEGEDINDILQQWCRDLEDTRGRIVKQEYLWNGIWLSTIWRGLDMRLGEGPPLIFETMAFYELTDKGEVWCHRWEDLQEAEWGHAWAKHEISSIWRTIQLWWSYIMESYLGENDGEES